MRIVNNTKSPMFFPYAGSGRRGVQLDPGQEGPEVSVSVLGTRAGRRIPTDAERGTIKIVADAQEQKVLKGRVPSGCLTCAGKAAPVVEEVVEEVVETPAVDEVEVAEVEEVVNDTPEEEGTTLADVEEPQVETITVEDTTEAESAEPVDAVAESLIAELSQMSGRGRATKLRHLKKNEDAGIQAALPKVIEHFEALKAEKKAAKKDKYDDMSNAELMSAAVTAGLDVNPGDSDEVLRKALRESNK